KETIPKVERFFCYLRERRDPDNDGLISIITPMESGMDLAPHFDPPLGIHDHNPGMLKKKINRMLEVYHRNQWDLDKIFRFSIFDFEDVAFNTIYALSLRALARLYGKLNNRQKSDELSNLAGKVETTIIEKLWDEEDRSFYGVYHKGGKELKSRVKTVSSLFPIALDLPDDYIEEIIYHLSNENEFWLNYPIPSVARDEPSFGPLSDSRHIWRGTTWINTNWFIARGLIRHKKERLYQELKLRTLRLVEKSGFCEFYDPFDGHPGRAERNFSWSTLVIDL
ncbi:MAG TPA: hypothetical protein EYP24_01430, partial [bacterium (Candidatus Stahlbacteria)]|nr:hypothetical protein [Candidatus Stahlbacteria bacterium]